MRGKAPEQDFRKYNAAQQAAARTICDALAECIDAGLNYKNIVKRRGRPARRRARRDVMNAMG